MNKHHQELINQIKVYSGRNHPDTEGFARKYVGTNKPWYHLNTSQNRSIAKDFANSFKNDHELITDTVTSLYGGLAYEEIIIAALIVQASTIDYRQQLNPKVLDTWLSFVCGWAETDTLCQMAFGAVDILPNWTNWERLLKKFAVDPNVHKRRASIVLLTKPVRLSSDSRLADMAFVNVDLLKHEKDILITKAVSWILRSLIKNHRSRVESYIKENINFLPKIAIREVTSKLNTGRKN